MKPSEPLITHYLCDELTKPLPVYSHAVIYNGEAHISAVQGFKPGTIVFPDDVADEANQMMLNLSMILQGVGSDFNNILKMTLFFVQMERDFPIVNDIINTYMPTHSPARSSIWVASLPKQARVVVDCSVLIHKAQPSDPDIAAERDIVNPRALRQHLQQSITTF